MDKTNKQIPYLWSDTANSLRDIAASKKIPLIGAFELTARCNFSCRMCYIRRPQNDRAVASRELTADEWIRIGKECLESGALYLLLTGGEPFLRKDFRKIYEALSEMGFFITLYTNASLLTTETISWLQKRPPSKLTITLYGASRDTYQRLCGNGNAFDQVIQNIEGLIDAGINVNIRSTITKTNVTDLDEMRRIAEKFNIPFDYTCMIFKAVRGAVSFAESERLSPQEILALHAKDTPPEFMNKTDYTYIKKQKKAAEPLSCSAGKSSWWITWDGRMIPCSLMDTPFAQVAGNSFNQAWKDIQKAVLDIPGAPECDSCNDKGYCSVCPGILQAETGVFDQTCDYICEFARQVKNQYQLYTDICP